MNKAEVKKNEKSVYTSQRRKYFRERQKKENKKNNTLHRHYVNLNPK